MEVLAAGFEQHVAVGLFLDPGESLVKSGRRFTAMTGKVDAFDEHLPETFGRPVTAVGIELVANEFLDGDKLLLSKCFVLELFRDLGVFMEGQKEQFARKIEGHGVFILAGMCAIRSNLWP